MHFGDRRLVLHVGTRCGSQNIVATGDLNHCLKRISCVSEISYQHACIIFILFVRLCNILQ